MVDERLDGPPRSGTRGAPVEFFHDGRRVRSFQGETVGAALHAAGVDVLMRSIKYRRPRGLFCGEGKCGNCLVRVDGRPNVRACITPVRENMRVRSQNGWPSVRFDVFSLVDKVYRRTFDYHDKFTWPGFMRPVYNGIIRRMAGFGRAPDEPEASVERPPVRVASPDVLVAGAGAAGLAAAVAAARAGARVLVVDERTRFGGRLLHDTRNVESELPFMGAGPEVAGALADELARAPTVTPYPQATVVGAYLPSPAEEPVMVAEGDGAPFRGVVGILTGRNFVEARPKALVVATGANDTLLPFPANDIPGIMSAGCAEGLLLDHAVRPGRRAVVVGFTDAGFRVSGTLQDAGVDVVAHVPAANEAAPTGAPARAPARPNARILRAVGGRRVRRVILAVGDDTERVDCDLVVLAHDGAPRVELLQQADCRLVYDAERRALLPALDKDGRASAPGVFACGRVAGDKPVADALEEGWRVGEAAARLAERVREVPP